MAWDKASLLIGRQCNGGVIHAKRIKYFFLEEGRIRRARTNRERVAQQAKSKIAIKKPGFLGPRHSMRGEKRVKISRMIVRVGILAIDGFEVVRHSRKTGVLRRQIEQSNLRTRGLLHCARRQQLPYRIVELNLSLFHHLRKNQTGEGLGD